MKKTEMPKFGYMAYPYGDIISEIKKGKRLGADYIEIVAESAHHPDTLIKENRQIKRELKKHGMFCTIHFAWWADMGSDYKCVRDGWVDECKRAIRVGKTIGARKFLVHARPQPGKSMIFPKFKKVIINHMIDSFNILAKFARKNGILLVIENEDVVSKIKDSDTKRISKEVKHAKLAIDTGHVNLGNTKKGMKNYIRKFIKKTDHCHFSDNNGIEDDHIPIGTGSIDYKMVVKELKKAGYNKTITLEIFNGGAKGYVQSLKKIKKLWEA